MKHFMTAFACLFAMNMSAQTGFVEFPYNPDSDNDDMIGTEDLLGLLSLYGSEFSEEGLYLSTDSTFATMHLGTMNYWDCIKGCYELPGNWRMTSAEDYARGDHTSFGLGDNNNTSLWLRPGIHYQPGSWDAQLCVQGDKIISEGQPNTLRECGCATHERPNVEYSYCEGYDIQTCTEQKVSEGWYPLGGISFQNSNSSQTYDRLSQAFWRWAE